MHELSPCQAIAGVTKPYVVGRWADELGLELIPEVSCRSCGAAAEIASGLSVVCRGCAGGDVVHGEQFLVTSVEVGDVPAVESSKGVLNG